MEQGEIPRTKTTVMRSAAILLILASSALSGAQEPDQVFGKGSFVFELLDGKSVRLHYYVPPTATHQSPVVVVCHGLSRNADDYRDHWIGKANGYGLIIVAPEFSAELFPGSRGYALGNVFRDGERPRRNELNAETVWTFSAIEPIFDEIKRRTSNDTKRYYIFGHSAGGQFVHRLLLFKPTGRYAALVAANAGWYTVPNERVTFPYGLRSTPVAENDFAFFAQPLVVMIGTEDNDPNARNLRQRDGARIQGPHRYARAHYFYDQSQTKAEGRGVEFAWKIVDVPGVGHSGFQMSRHAADYLFGGERVYGRDRLATQEEGEREDEQGGGGLRRYPPEEIDQLSSSKGEKSAIGFVNRTREEVSLYWRNDDGEEFHRGELEAGQTMTVQTFAGRVWIVRNQKEEVLWAFQAQKATGEAVIQE